MLSSAQPTRVEMWVMAWVVGGLGGGHGLGVEDLAGFGVYRFGCHFIFPAIARRVSSVF